MPITNGFFYATENDPQLKKWINEHPDEYNKFIALHT